jgi:hypothetical protein
MNVWLARLQGDTTHAQVVERYVHHRHGWYGIVCVVIWLLVVLYVLFLATRVVRAIEKIADKFQGRGP